MTRILTIRPEPGASATVTAGRALGLAIEAAPLFEIGPLAWEAPDPESIEGLLIGSANVFRHGGKAVDLFRAKPVYAVGEASAAAARAAGFSVAQTGDSDLQTLLRTIVPPIRLLRLAGEEHVTVEPPPGVEIDIRLVYRARPLPLPDKAAGLLQPGAVVLLHSGAASRHFASECDRLGIRRSGIRLAALAPRVATAAGPGWQRIAVAAKPSESHLLALAGELCHDRDDVHVEASERAEER